jgi:hypothetical protein
MGQRLGTPISGNLINCTGYPGVATNTTNITTLQTPPVFKIYLATQQAITSATHTKVSFDTLIVDSHSGWDSTNKRYVGKRSGWYRFGWHLYCGVSTTVTSGFSSASVNGTAATPTNVVGLGNSFGNDGICLTSGNALLFLNGTTDYFELYAYITATTPLIGITARTELAMLSCEWIRS